MLFLNHGNTLKINNSNYCDVCQNAWDIERREVGSIRKKSREK